VRRDSCLLPTPPATDMNAAASRQGCRVPSLESSKAQQVYGLLAQRSQAVYWKASGAGLPLPRSGIIAP